MAIENIGVVVRTFSRKEGGAEARVEQTAALLDLLESLGIPYSNHVVVVPSDNRYPTHDYGGTTKLLTERIDGTVAVLRTKGDYMVGALNAGIAQLASRNIEWGLIISPEAQSYLSTSLMEEISAIIQAGQNIRVIGVALPELGEQALQGFIANTFAVWHIPTLLEVGGFHQLSAERMNGEETELVTASHPELGEQSYPLHGVEEVIPLAQMVQRFGSCIQVLIPKQGEYELANNDDPDQAERNLAKFHSKEVRQQAMLNAMGLSWDLIPQGVAR